MEQKNNTGRAQQIEVTAETTSVEITSGHDLTRMSSADLFKKTFISLAFSLSAS